MCVAAHLKNCDSFATPFRNVGLRPGLTFPLKQVILNSLSPQNSSLLLYLPKLQSPPDLPRQTERHKGTDQFLMHLSCPPPFSFSHSKKEKGGAKKMKDVQCDRLSHCTSFIFFLSQYIPTGLTLQYTKFHWDSPEQKTRGRSGTGISQAHTNSHTHKSTESLSFLF